MAQYYPGTTKVAQNRRNLCDPDYDLEKIEGNFRRRCCKDIRSQSSR